MIIDAIRAEWQVWVSPENRTEVIESVGPIAVLLAAFLGVSLWPYTQEVQIFERRRHHEVSAAWTAYVEDRLQAGDFSCDDGAYTMQIGSVSNVWVSNYPYSFGVAPSLGVMPADETSDKLHRVLMACLEAKVLSLN